MIQQAIWWYHQQQTFLQQHKNINSKNIMEKLLWKMSRKVSILPEKRSMKVALEVFISNSMIIDHLLCHKQFFSGQPFRCTKPNEKEIQSCLWISLSQPYFVTKYLTLSRRFLIGLRRERVKSGPSNICGRQPLKNLKGYGLLKQTVSVQIF